MQDTLAVSGGIPVIRRLPLLVKIGIVVTVFLVATFAALFLAGVIFMLLNKTLPHFQLLTWYQYWWYYGDDPSVSGKLYGSLAFAMAVTYLIPVVLYFVASSQRPLHAEGGRNLMLKKLIIGLMLLSVGAVAIAFAAELPMNQKADKAQKAQYPPYPDVWDWQVHEEDMPIYEGVGVKVKQMDNGDVMIAYRPDKKGEGFRYITFFGKKKVTDTAAVYKDDYGTDAKEYMPLNSKLTLRGGGGGTRSGGCYEAISFFIALYDEVQKKHIFRKRLLEIFDKPKYYETHYPRCLDGPSFNYQVAAVSAEYLPLKDGTFLMIVPEGYVIRFDEKFQTKSKLINDRFFWMDDNDMHDFESAKYGDRIEGHVNLKQLYSDLYQLLLKKRGEKR